MNLKTLLEKTSAFQKVEIFYRGNEKCGTAGSLLENLGKDWLESQVLEIKADFSKLMIEIGNIW